MRIKSFVVALVCLCAINLHSIDKAFATQTILSCQGNLESLKKYLLSSELLSRNGQEWRWFLKHEPDLAVPMLEEEGTGFRGMKLSPAQLQTILRHGLDPADSYFNELYFAWQPTFALSYAVIPGFNDPKITTGVLSVVFQISTDGLKFRTNGVGFTVREKIGVKHLLRLWIYDPYEANAKRRFIEFGIR